MCEHCKLLVDLNCANVNLKTENSKIARLWSCHVCTLRELPLYHQDVLPLNKKEVAVDNYINTHVTKLQELKTHISICHLNTQSMTSTFDEFMVIESKFDIITLSEIRLKNDKYVNLPGYKFSNRNRDEKRGGGVDVYIKFCITFKIRSDITSLDDSLEHLWVEGKGKNKKSPYLIGIIYQPSSENAKKIEWIKKIDAVLSSIKSLWDSTIILTGDTNNDLLSSSTTRDMYEQMLHKYQLSCHITKSTRKGKKLIDHMSSSICKNKILHSDVLLCPTVSDHDAPYIIVNVPTNNYEIRYKFIRNLKLFDLETYINDFQTLPFVTVYSFNETDDQLDTLNKLILSVIDKHAPLVKTKSTIPPAPWMKDIKINKLQRDRDHWRHEAHKNPTDKNWGTYREYRNKIKKPIREKKTQFYRKVLSSKNSKEIWKVIHRILNPNTSTLQADPSAVNEFFNKTAERLARQKVTTDGLILSQIDSLTSNHDSVKLQKVTYNDVLKSLKSLRNDYSTGYDNIPVSFIKPIAENIASPLTFIINNLIEESKFPDQWKIACISPTPKVTNPTELKDYRPISILPVLSKVHEKQVLHQITEFIETQQVYNKHQSRYRKSHSTATILSKLYDDIKIAMKQSELTMAVFTLKSF